MLLFLPWCRESFSEKVAEISLTLTTCTKRYYGLKGSEGQKTLIGPIPVKKVTESLVDGQDNIFGLNNNKS